MFWSTIFIHIGKTKIFWLEIPTLTGYKEVWTKIYHTHIYVELRKPVNIAVNVNVISCQYLASVNHKRECSHYFVITVQPFKIEKKRNPNNNFTVKYLVEINYQSHMKAQLKPTRYVMGLCIVTNQGSKNLPNVSSGEFDCVTIMDWGACLKLSLQECTQFWERTEF